MINERDVTGAYPTQSESSAISARHPGWKHNAGNTFIRRDAGGPGKHAFVDTWHGQFWDGTQHVPLLTLCREAPAEFDSMADRYLWAAEEIFRRREHGSQPNLQKEPHA
jgi:hypothetical protein